MTDDAEPAARAGARPSKRRLSPTSPRAGANGAIGSSAAAGPPPNDGTLFDRSAVDSAVLGPAPASLASVPKRPRPGPRPTPNALGEMHDAVVDERTPSLLARVRSLLSRRQDDELDEPRCLPTPTPNSTPSGRPRCVPLRPPGTHQPSVLRPAPGPGRARRLPPRSRRGTDSADRPSTAAPDLSRFLAASKAQPGDDKRGDGRRNSDDGLRGHDGVFRLLLRARRYVIIGGIAVIAAVLLRIFVVAPYYIPSASMEPTLHGCPGCNDDHVLVDKLSYRVHDPHQSDLVVFARPKNINTAEPVLIKRVIGLPGDRLQLEGGRVYINGVVLDEAYIRKACGGRASTPHTRQSRWTIPKGDVFVMGDNRCDSTDSRDFGPIPQSSIVGRAFAIIWPLGRITSL